MRRPLVCLSLAGKQRAFEHAAVSSAPPGLGGIRGTTMKRVVLAAILALSLQACAQSSGSAPSYLGFTAAADESGDTSDASPGSDSHPELRHVASNKVLGAMAFQQVTGRAIDPSRLNSGR